MKIIKCKDKEKAKKLEEKFVRMRKRVAILHKKEIETEKQNPLVKKADVVIVIPH